MKIVNTIISILLGFCLSTLAAMAVPVKQQESNLIDPDLVEKITKLCGKKPVKVELISGPKIDTGQTFIKGLKPGISKQEMEKIAQKYEFKYDFNTFKEKVMKSSSGRASDKHVNDLFNLLSQRSNKICLNIRKAKLSDLEPVRVTAFKFPLTSNTVIDQIRAIAKGSSYSVFYCFTPSGTVSTKTITVHGKTAKVKVADYLSCGMLVNNVSPADLIRVFETCDKNSDVGPETIAKKVEEWDKKYDLSVRYIGQSGVELYCKKLPSNSKSLFKEIDKFCPGFLGFPKYDPRYELRLKQLRSELIKNHLISLSWE